MQKVYMLLINLIYMLLVFLAIFFKMFISSFPVLLSVFKLGPLVQFLLSFLLGLRHFSFSTFNWSGINKHGLIVDLCTLSNNYEKLISFPPFPQSKLFIKRLPSFSFLLCSNVEN